VIRPSLKLIKAGYAVTLALFLAGAVYSFIQPQIWTAIAGAVLLLWPVKRHIQRQATKMTIEADKLRYETGLLSKSTRSIQLSKVQDVRVDQSLKHRMLGIGNLSIETAGETSRLTIANIDAPQQVADRIMDAAQQRTAEGHGV